MFRLYGRLLRYLRPHLGTLAASILFMIGFAAFNGFSLAMIVPFTEIVLSGKSPEELARLHSGRISTGVPGFEISLPGGLSAGEPANPATTPANNPASNPGSNPAPIARR